MQGEPEKANTPAEASSYDLHRRSLVAVGGASVVVALDRLLQVLLLVVVARLVTPGETTVAAAAASVISAASLFSSFGIPAGLVQLAALPNRLQAVARGALLFNSLVFIIAAELLAPWAGAWFRNPEVTKALRVLALVLAVQPLALIPTALLSRALKAREVAVADLVGNLAGTALVTIPMALAGLGWMALVFGSMAQITVRSVWLSIRVRQWPRIGFSWREGREIYRSGAGFFLNGAVGTLTHAAPRWMTGHYLPGPDLGIFSRADGLASYPTGLFAAVAERVIFPAIALVQAEGERLRSAAIQAVELIAALGLPLTAALIILGPDIILSILGGGWRPAIWPFRILSLAVYFRLADRLNWVILRGLGQPYRLARMQFISLVAMVVGCLAAAPFGLGALCAAASLATLCSYALTSFAAMRLTGVGAGSWLAAHGPGICGGVLAMLTLWPSSLLLHRADLAPIAVLGGCALISLLVGALALRLLPSLFIGAAGERLLETVRNGARRARA